MIFETKRPFNWGGVLVMDSETADIPGHADDDGVAITSTCVSFAVRHAQDTTTDEAFEVALVVRRGRSQSPTIEHLIQVPSRAITVGDAEGEERIEIDASACLVGIEVDEPRHAEHVTVWLEPRP